jgi:hypothetical protein
MDAPEDAVSGAVGGDEQLGAEGEGRLRAVLAAAPHRQTIGRHSQEQQAYVDAGRATGAKAQKPVQGISEHSHGRLARAWCAVLWACGVSGEARPCTVVGVQSG